MYHLFKKGIASDDTVILGITRRNITKEQLLAQVELCVNETDKICDPTALAKVHAALQMHQMSLTDGHEYDELLTLLNDIEASHGVCMDRLYYLSIPPQMFEPIVRNLGQHGLNTSCQHGIADSRLLIEKPFGYDIASAKELLAETAEWFGEDQTFRIDHYVAKSPVIELLDFRRNHPGLQRVWNGHAIDSIEITAYEELDIEGRAVFYDSIGALRDIIQSHLLQVMAVAMMKIPAGGDTTALHAARLELLQSITPITTAGANTNAVRAQYHGYPDEVGRNDTATETYAELRLTASTADWHGTRVRLRTGKAMAHKSTEIRIRFTAGAELICHIQPENGLELVIDGRADGGEIIDLLQAAMADNSFQGKQTKDNPYGDAYERVLVEAANGERNIFTTSEEVLAAWRLVQNVIELWGKNADGLLHYPKGSSEVVVG